MIEQARSFTCFELKFRALIFGFKFKFTERERELHVKLTLDNDSSYSLPLPPSLPLLMTRRVHSTVLIRNRILILMSIKANA